MANSTIQFNHVSKNFQNQTIINNINFEIEEGQFITILGSSGSGKTTTLKMMNRLIEPDSGNILINGTDISQSDVVELRRNIGYVVQQIGLFPHLTIERNIATVPDLLKWGKEKTIKRVKEVMELVQLPYESFHNRYPSQLSGGQQQRIGVARALAANPKIMLLDEPFGAVDAITRKELQKQIKVIHQELNDKTFLFVTHDINEAFRLGDKVMIMNEGEISQFDTPEAIVSEPKTSFVHELLETAYEEESIWRGLK